MHFVKPARSALMVLLLLGSCIALSGCAVLGVLSSAETLAHGPPPLPSRETETNLQRYARPVIEVYSALIAVVEKDGRKIVERNADTHSVLVTYPFSWLQNNWGGVITITCTSEKDITANAGTSVRVIGGARDAIFRIRKIGESILQDLDAELSRLVVPAPPRASDAGVPVPDPR